MDVDVSRVVSHTLSMRRGFLSITDICVRQLVHNIYSPK
jgi:hypothetical protein